MRGVRRHMSSRPGAAMSRFIFLLAIPTLLRAQVTSTLSGIPCERLADRVPTSTQIDSLRHRDPVVDADSAFALGELRLWSFNFGAEVPGTMGSMVAVDSVMARLDPSAATLPPARLRGHRAARCRPGGTRQLPRPSDLPIFRAHARLLHTPCRGRYPGDGPRRCAVARGGERLCHSLQPPAPSAAGRMRAVEQVTPAV
jgi:hypothetical protein